MSGDSKFFVVSVKYTRAVDLFITVWRENNNGYAHPLAWAGRYDGKTIQGNLGYYNDGQTIAVPCEVVERLAVDNTWKGRIDNNTGPVVLNTRENWKILLASVIKPPARPPKPKPMRKRSDAAREMVAHA